MKIQQLASLADVSAAEWNALDGAAQQPFLSHEFLEALESSGSAVPATGWRPSHLVARDERGRLRGALLLYLKDHSRGEFVFDWSWANAYAQSGLPYYPKLVSAVPFTPVTGPRALLATTGEDAGLRRDLLAAAADLAEDLGLSSVHVLFPADPERDAVHALNWSERMDCQFHWQNRGYGDFEDFLQSFRSSKRKKARRERRRIAEAGIRFRRLSGDELLPAEWEHVCELCARTFRLRGREPYLNLDFFRRVAHRIPQSLLVILAEYRGRAVAAAICFRSADTLFGRYWGAAADFDGLHFETCYYQGIDYCIETGLQRFEPGTQGEHKIARGFLPVATWSAHYLSHTGFDAAVRDFVERERPYVEAYMRELNAHSPYRQEAC